MLIKLEIFQRKTKMKKSIFILCCAAIITACASSTPRAAETEQSDDKSERIVRKFVFMDENGKTVTGDLANELDIEVFTEGDFPPIPMIHGEAMPMRGEGLMIHEGAIPLLNASSVTVSTSGEENSVSIIQQQGGFWYVEDDNGEDSFVFCNLKDGSPSCKKVDISHN
jgi:hypothetical protein